MATGRIRITAVWALIFFLISVTLVFATIRISTDSANLAQGVVPDEDSFDRRYALLPVLAYAHILPGMIYLCGAPFQLSRGFRSTHLALHRKMGRILVATGQRGLRNPLRIVVRLRWNPRIECRSRLRPLLSPRHNHRLPRDQGRRRGPASKMDDQGLRHRFAVGTIRIWVGLFKALGLLAFEQAFGPAFWLSSLMHTAAAEAWLRWRVAPIEA